MIAMEWSSSCSSLRGERCGWFLLVSAVERLSLYFFKMKCKKWGWVFALIVEKLSLCSNESLRDIVVSCYVGTGEIVCM